MRTRQTATTFVKTCDGISDFSIEFYTGEIEPACLLNYWLIRGTSSGSEFSFEGASILHVEGEEMRSDECYSRKALE
jgi:hypothetical protein